MPRFIQKYRDKFARRVAKQLAPHLDAVLSDTLARRIGQHDADERLLMLAGRQACWRLKELKQIDSLADVEFRVFSQWGEDGIIEWLIQNLHVDASSFVEFGVENYREANTRFLLQNRNWRGLVMDANEQYARQLQVDRLYWMFDVTFKPAFVTAENINELIQGAGFAGEVGILSIDIDGNDYWVLEKIDCVSPAIIICEYNPIFGDRHPVTIPYAPRFTRFEGHFSGLYFGASIAALRMLAERKGYRFVGTNSNGINAFFVRRDLLPAIEARIAHHRAWPSRHRDSRSVNGTLDFTAGMKRHELIRHLPVVRVDTGETVSLASLGPAFSDSWLRELGAEGYPARR